MKKLLSVYLLLIIRLSFAQDGQFSQYFSSPALVNPAILGVIPEIEFSANYKQGGSKSTGTYVEMMQATFSHPLKSRAGTSGQMGGIGATFFRENRGFEGIYTSQKLLANGAYSLKLSQFTNHFLVFGLQGGIVQNRLASEHLRWGSQFNQFLSSSAGYDNSLPAELLNAETIWYPVFNFGTVYTLYDNEDYLVRDRSFTVGISADNLNRPATGSLDDDVIRKNILYKAFGIGRFEITPRIYLHPTFLVLRSGESFQTNGGFYVSTALQPARSETAVLLHAGTWYRVEDSFIILGGLQINHIRVAGSIDLNTSQLAGTDLFGEAPPTYEISLKYNFVASKKINRISNPIF